jgi:hypothetical protein
MSTRWLYQGKYLGIIVLCAALFLAGWRDTRTVLHTNAHRPYLISLGGSIAAGVGLTGAYDNPYNLPHACGETDESYAVIIAREQHLPLLQLACSGAETTHGLFSDQMVRHHLLRPQVSEVKKKALNSIATIFIGANDVHWIHFQHVCFMSGCPPQTPPPFQNGFTGVSDDLTNAIRDLHHDGARAIVVNEYYTAITKNNPMNCEQHMLTSEDISTYNAMLTQLNNAITTGYEHADVASAYLIPLSFQNHGICSAHPWVQGLTDNQPFHPTRAGQDAIAQADESVLLGHGV